MRILWPVSFHVLSFCRFAKLEGSDPEAIVIRFFGIFFFFFQCNSILGNIISTAVLSSGNKTHVQLSDQEMALCGRAFCSQRAVAAESVEVSDDGITLAPSIEEESVPNANFDTDITKIYIIAAIYLACSIAAALLVAFFVDPLSRFDTTDERRDRTPSTGLQLLVATFRHMKKKEQILVIPITFWSGIEQGFFGADFTAVSGTNNQSEKSKDVKKHIFRDL